MLGSPGIRTAWRKREVGAGAGSVPGAVAEPLSEGVDGVSPLAGGMRPASGSLSSSVEGDGVGVLGVAAEAEGEGEGVGGVGRGACAAASLAAPPPLELLA